MPLLSQLVSPLLGGPKYHLGQRPDQYVQFFPQYLMLIYLMPVLLLERRRRRPAGRPARLATMA
jgi:hypothetical protein